MQLFFFTFVFESKLWGLIEQIGADYFSENDDGMNIDGFPDQCRRQKISVVHADKRGFAPGVGKPVQQ